MNTNDSLKIYRRQALSVARDFCYSNTVIAKIKTAKNEAEICRIMITARQNKKW